MSDVLLQPWSEEDLPLLEKLLGDPEMMTHLGGPESPEQILRRHQRYLHLPKDGTDHMFKIIWGLNGEGVGSVGYWKKTWRDQAVYETGWLVLPAYQGHGIATKATALVIEHAQREHKYQFMHAFPSVENVASNAICRKLGFTLVEACQVEYPPGHALTVNDWRLDLFRQ
ncbi:MAG TPA: GNAT family N-acetyltransferase [Anaerolineales bacterium]|nr:GNAT family N-acetyltransferase [Anaerolineales bacterium]